MVEIDDHAFMNCPHLHNIAFSPDSNYYDYCHESLNFPFHKLSHADGEIYAGRFEWHRIRTDCVFTIPITKLKPRNTNTTIPWNGLLDPEEIFEVDCLGMTALHVLACSGMHDLHLYRRIVDG